MLVSSSRIPLPLLLVLLAGFLCIPPMAQATTVLKLTSDQLVQRAADIVHATCTRTTSYRNDQGLIVTRYEFRTLDSLKGGRAERFVCVQPGGIVGNVMTVLPGLSSHNVGDEVILFLHDDVPAARFQLPLGLDQGVYRVVADPNGAAIVKRSLKDLHMAQPTGSAAPTDAHPLPEGVSLDAFKTELKARINSSAGNEKR